MMNLIIQHVEIHVSSLDEAKHFYISQLGLELLDETPALNLVSLKAGDVRISIFAGFERNAAADPRKTGTHLIFRTDDLDATMDTLRERGVQFRGEVFEAPGFLRGIGTSDPDGNVTEIVQYLRDPLKRAE